MKKYIMITGILLTLICNTAIGRHYTDWTGFEFKTGRLDSKDRIVYYELQKDYTIDLSEYFEVAEKLPDCCGDALGGYWSLARSATRRADWDFITYEQGGILTIKKGYRWDGASLPCKEYDENYCPDEYHNFRSSCVHDVLYDLMRMEYHDADYNHGAELVDGTCKDNHVLWDAGDDNRRFADMMHYMIAMEDTDPKDDAQSDYFWLRVWGACPTHDDEKLCGWKYHVSDLTAYAENNRVELEWNHPNVAQKDPDFDDHFIPITGYSIKRNGEVIDNFGAIEWISNPPLLPYPSWVTSYTDNSAVNGTAYTYQVTPLTINTNQDDWSNTDVAVPNNGPGNCLQLDGSNDYVECNNASNDFVSTYNSPLLLSFTYEAWVYPDGQNGDADVILAFNTIDGENYNHLAYYGQYQTFYYYDNYNGEDRYIRAERAYPTNNWYHVAVTFDEDNNGILYVDGVQQATFSNTLKPEHGAKFSIGQEFDQSLKSQYFKGKIDEVRIWRNVVRTQGEIQANMNIPLRGDEDGLVGLWHFDEPNDLFTTVNFPNYVPGRKTYDATFNGNDGLLIGYVADTEETAFVPSGAMGVVTYIADNSDESKHIPEKFTLQQNYPNPFNPSTNIEFALPRAEFVTIDIFNILGKKVETLVSRQLTAGNYSVTWDATKASSGVYLYKISAGEFFETKKMTLIK